MELERYRVYSEIARGIRKTVSRFQKCKRIHGSFR